MATKAIPFTQEDRATIRSTSLWMLISGALLTLLGGYQTFLLSDAFAAFGMMTVQILTGPVLLAIGLLALGILLLIGSRRFATVAVSGDIGALSGGLTVLTIIYVVQAVVMLLGIALFVFSVLRMMM